MYETIVLYKNIIEGFRLVETGNSERLLLCCGKIQFCKNVGNRLRISTLKQ